jgi:hypothetical protein
VTGCDDGTIHLTSSRELSSHTKMLQRLPAAALSKTGVFSASRAAPLRVIQRSSSVGTVLWVLPPCFRVGFVHVHDNRPGSRLPVPRLPTHSRSVKPTSLHAMCLIGSLVAGLFPSNPRFCDAPCYWLVCLVHPLVRNPSVYRGSTRVFPRRGWSSPSRISMATQGLAGLV